MGAVLKFDNRSIHDIYLFIFTFTVVVIIEALITALRTGEVSTLPIFLIGSTIGYSLFWLIEFVVWRFILLGKTKRTKYLQGVIFFSRCTVLGGLLYFLFASIDIIYAIITCIVYCGSMWFGSKEDDAKSITKIEMFYFASHGLISILTFCIGYFGGRWLGGHFGNAEIGSYIGVALGFVVTFVLGDRIRKQRSDAQKAQDTKEDNLLRLSNDLPLS